MHQSMNLDQKEGKRLKTFHYPHPYRFKSLISGYMTEQCLSVRPCIRSLPFWMVVIGAQPASIFSGHLAERERAEI